MYLYKTLFKTAVSEIVFKCSERGVHFVNNSQNKLTQSEYKSLKDFNAIPGPKSYPLVGTLYKYLPIIGDYNAETLDQNAWLNYRRYGSLTRESLTNDVQILHVFDPDDIEAVFRQEGKLPARRSHVALKHYRLSKPEVYNTGGLLSSNGEEWWKLRSSFQKNFASPKSVKEHVETTDGIIIEFLEWIKASEMTPSNDFLPFLSRLNLEATVCERLSSHAAPLFCNLTSITIPFNAERDWLNRTRTVISSQSRSESKGIVIDVKLQNKGAVIGAIAFNERFNSFSPNEQKETSNSSKMIDAAFGSNGGIVKLDKGFMWKIINTPLYNKLVSSQDFLEKISRDILSKAKTSTDLLKNKSLLASFLQLPDVDEKDVIGMMVDILMASIDTTAYSTSFMLYHLSRHSQTQEKLFEEVSSLLPTKKSPITVEIINKAVYTRSCMKESLRLNPVSIGVGRILQKDIVLKGYLIPEGTLVLTQNMVASRLPLYVKNPLNFKPERWLRNSEEFENIHPFLTLPFGFGPRSCIARRLAEQTMCITLMRLMREFNLSWNGGELHIRTHLINKPDHPVRLLFKPR